MAPQGPFSQLSTVTPTYASNITYARLTSLGACKKDFRWNATSWLGPKLNSEHVYRIHDRMAREYTRKRSKVGHQELNGQAMLHLGTSDTTNIFILFPRALRDPDTGLLGETDLKLWTDLVMIPALDKAIPNTSMYRDPSAATSSYSMIKKTSETKHMACEYYMPIVEEALMPRHLRKIWSVMQDIVNEEGSLDCFKDMVLFAFKASDLPSITLGNMLSTCYYPYKMSAEEIWQEEAKHWDEYMDPRHVKMDTFYVRGEFHVFPEARVEEELNFRLKRVRVDSITSPKRVPDVKKARR